MTLNCNVGKIAKSDKRVVWLCRVSGLGLFGTLRRSSSKKGGLNCSPPSPGVACNSHPGHAASSKE